MKERGPRHCEGGTTEAIHKDTMAGLLRFARNDETRKDKNRKQWDGLSLLIRDCFYG